MAKLTNSLTWLIGNVPLLGLERVSSGLPTEVLVKLALCDSANDYVGFSFIKDAEEKGLITKSTVIIEPTNGKIGTALIFVAIASGYRLILVMPDTVSVEQRDLLEDSGAEVVLTPGVEGMEGALRKAQQLAVEFPNVFIPQQFKKLVTPNICRGTTVEEIWADTRGEVDIFIGGVGNGSAIIGVGEIIKKYNPEFSIVIVEAFHSPVVADKKLGFHKAHGSGTGLAAYTLNLEVVNEVYKVTREEAFDMVKRLAKEEGMLVGLSSGAITFAALQIAGRLENQGKKVVAILPDSGERYLSKPLFHD